MRIDNSKIAVIIGFSAILRKSFSTGCNWYHRYIYIACFVSEVFYHGFRIWSGSRLGTDRFGADCLQERFNLNYSFVP